MRGFWLTELVSVIVVAARLRGFWSLYKLPDRVPVAMVAACVCGL